MPTVPAGNCPTVEPSPRKASRQLNPVNTPGKGRGPINQVHSTAAGGKAPVAATAWRHCQWHLGRLRHTWKLSVMLRRPSFRKSAAADSQSESDAECRRDSEASRPGLTRRLHWPRRRTGRYRNHRDMMSSTEAVAASRQRRGLGLGAWVTTRRSRKVSLGSSSCAGLRAGPRLLGSPAAKARRRRLPTRCPPGPSPLMT